MYFFIELNKGFIQGIKYQPGKKNENKTMNVKEREKMEKITWSH